MSTLNSKDQIIDALRAVKAELRSQYRVVEIGVFGSFVRDEAVVSSDIDILVEFAPDADLFDQVGVKLRLESLFHRKVDVVSKNALRAGLREIVLKEVVAA